MSLRLRRAKIYKLLLLTVILFVGLSMTVSSGYFYIHEDFVIENATFSKQALKSDSPKVLQVNPVLASVKPPMTSTDQPIAIKTLRKNVPVPPVKSIPINNLLEDVAFPLKSQHITIHGTRRTEQMKLVIGIPTIVRETVGTSYLGKTLDNIRKRTTEEERRKSVVLVFAADFSESKRSQIRSLLQTYHKDWLTSGFLQLMEVTPGVYPPLEGLKRNFNDEPLRVTWRSKQVIDFAFMFWYGRLLGTYYLQIEDDVECADNFVTLIEKNIASQTKQWTLLEYSVLGFIGKLYKSIDLDGLAKFLYLFYTEQPVDFLFRYHMQLMMQRKPLFQKPTLFQHFGDYSSLRLSKKQKMNKLKDKFFVSYKPPDKKEIAATKNITDADNPPATVETDMGVYENYHAKLAYSKKSGDFFWGKNVNENSHFCVRFLKTWHVKSVDIHTGTKVMEHDNLHSGEVLFGTYTKNIPVKPYHCGCNTYHAVATFNKGIASVSDYPSASPAVQCILIQVNQAQQNWLIIEQFAVRVRK